MERENIEEKLIRHAKRYAERRGFHFGEGVEQHLLPQVALRATRDIYDQPEKYSVAQAQRAIETYIDEMIRAAGRIPDYERLHPDSIGERTWGEAQIKLCPGFWPFC